MPQRTSKKTTGKKSPKKKASVRRKKKKTYLVKPARQLLGDVIILWRKNWRPLVLITLLYGAFYFIFVRALTNFDVPSLRNVVDQVFGTESGNVGSSLVLTGAVFGLSLELDQVSGLYAAILIIIFSLAFLWVLRHIWAGKPTTLRKAFYQGMYPLVPVLIILVVVSLQLIPMSIGGFVLGNALANDIAIRFWEQALVWAFFLTMVVLSGYWITGSIMAFYISTVPEMTPMKALRTAKEILKGRRLLVLQRILTFLIFTGVLSFIILFITILLAEKAALVVVTAMSVVGLMWLHSYFFILYRSLIDE